MYDSQNDDRKLARGRVWRVPCHFLIDVSKIQSHIGLMKKRSRPKIYETEFYFGFFFTLPGLCVIY